MKVVQVFGAVLLAGTASIANASVGIDEASVSELMAQCSSAEGGSQAQLDCFALLAERIKQQEANQASSGESPVIKSLEGLRAVAEYADTESGLEISGNGCLVNILYYGNYYRISRRNISGLDLYSAQFNASQLQYEQTTQLQNSALTRVRAVMESGATAVSKGGSALESVALNFEPKSASASIGEYATSVASQLPAKQDQTFEFVLVHPQRANATNEIFNAFASFVQACKQ